MKALYYIVPQDIHLQLEGKMNGLTTYDDAWIQPYGWVCAKWLSDYFPELNGLPTVEISVE